MNNVISSAEEVTREWLTAVLGRSGALAKGEVTDIKLDVGQANWSTNARLTVKYSDDAAGEPPHRLFLKMAQADPDDEAAFDDSEVRYYLQDYTDMPDTPLVRCYDGAYSKHQKRYHLLLEDLSDTHTVTLEKTPTLEYGYALAEGLAVMHARWWGAEKLSEANAPIHSAAFIQRFVDICQPGVAPVLQREPNDLEPHWPDLIHEIYAKHPQALIERTGNDNGFTLIHGDIGEQNILVPRRGERPIYLIDRQPFNWALTTWLS